MTYIVVVGWGRKYLGWSYFKFTSLWSPVASLLLSIPAWSPLVPARPELATPLSRAAAGQLGCLLSPIKPLDNRRSCIRFHPEIQGRTTQDEAQYWSSRSSGPARHSPARGRDLPSQREGKRKRPSQSEILPRSPQDAAKTRPPGGC